MEATSLEECLLTIYHKAFVVSPFEFTDTESGGIDICLLPAVRKGSPHCIEIRISIRPQLSAGELYLHIVTCGGGNDGPLVKDFDFDFTFFML